MKGKGTYLVVADLHYPEHNKKSFNAVLDFLDRNKVDGFIFLGDNLDCQNISRHTKGKPRLRKTGGYTQDIEGFKREILEPIEKRLKKDCDRIWIQGNHEDWLADFLDECPELQGTVDIPKNLGIRDNWTVIECGGTHKIGKVLFLHGDQVGSSIHVSKKLVSSFCQTAIMGHCHTYQTHTLAAQANKDRKWIGYVIPCLSTTAPHYAKGKPNSFINGVGIVEFFGDNFNVYVSIIMNGVFSYGGKIYGETKVK